MQPVAALTGITTHPEIDTVIIWNDGNRNIAHAYQHGRLIRTTPLATENQIDELRGAFRIGDGQLYAFAGMIPVESAPDPPVPAMQRPPGPRRWS